MMEAVGGLVCLVLYLAVIVLMIIGMWLVFEKAREPGWQSIIPIYNIMVLGRIAGKGDAYGLLCLIPIAGILFYAQILYGVCERFGKSQAYAMGLFFLPFIFWPMLGFSADSETRPRRRRRREWDDDDRPPRRRPRDEEDDYDDRPRRRRDDDDRPPRRRPPADDEDDDPPRRRPPDDRVSPGPPRRPPPPEDDDDDRPPPRRRPRDDDDQRVRRRPDDD